MKPIKNKFIITFPTIEAAMAMEKACLVSGTPGRLIPVPTQISAGCGMCWCAEPRDGEACRLLVKERKLVYEAFEDI